ncbi:MAG: hypothetical protein ACLQVY_00475 [Limisphaerales bacterium]
MYETKHNHSCDYLSLTGLPSRNDLIVENEWRKCEHKGTGNGLLDECIDKNVNSYYYSFIHLEPMIYGTLSWAHKASRTWEPESFKLREESFRNLLFLTCFKLNLGFNDIRFYFKHEFGSGECHAHFLIFRRGTEKVAPDVLSKEMNAIWMNGYDGYPRKRWQVIKRGTALVQPIDDIRKCVAYVCKLERDEYGNEIDTVDIVSPKLRNQIMRFNEGN